MRKTTINVLSYNAVLVRDSNLAHQADSLRERERERVRGQWAVYYTSPQSFMITCFYFFG